MIFLSLSLHERFAFNIVVKVSYNSMLTFFYYLQDSETPELFTDIYEFFIKYHKLDNVDDEIFPIKHTVCFPNIGCFDLDDSSIYPWYIFSIHQHLSLKKLNINHEMCRVIFPSFLTLVLFWWISGAFLCRWKISQTLGSFLMNPWRYTHHACKFK